ncbi:MULTISPECIES: ABC transporter permease [unclassified Streptomyces]|uniref:ABC transporter permease n=1 Tax=unclassified Streptomyces TaxID=2593676 RepID=UPI00093CF56F|nr:ABC transporter permease subunit [Streptomyces sp. CB02058]OKI98388.1 transporter [Streptomyces sp. CB02058]
MIWLTWRQYRVQTLVALAALVAVTATLVITGFQLRDTYDSTVAVCGSDCGAARNAFVTRYATLSSFVTGLLIAVPGLMGVFWGAPLIAREMETGTHRLIWNQSITRTHWLGVKLTAVGLAAVAVTALLSLMVTWWASPLDEINSDRFTPVVFDGRGIVPLAYAAFAFTVGVCAGLLIRRTVPAMAATLAVFVAVQVLMPFVVRPHFMAPVRAEIALAALGLRGGGPGEDGNGAAASGSRWEATNISMSGEGDAAQVVVGVARPGAWVVSGSGPVLDSSGREVRGAEGCARRDIDPVECFAKSDLHVEVAHHPADRYWTFQWIETGVFLALAGLLTGFCTWWLRRRLN